MSILMGQGSGEGSRVGTELMGAALQGIVQVTGGFGGSRGGDRPWGHPSPFPWEWMMEISASNRDIMCSVCTCPDGD